MEYSLIYPVGDAILRYKPHCKYDCTRRFKNSSSNYYSLHENGGGVLVIEQRKVLRDYHIVVRCRRPLYEHEKQHRHGHEAETAYLNQSKYHYLPEQSPVFVCNFHRQTGDTGRARGGEQRGTERDRRARSRRYREHK